MRASITLPVVLRPAGEEPIEVGARDQIEGTPLRLEGVEVDRVSTIGERTTKVREVGIEMA